jgi:putative ABC transport system permease protein
MHAGTRARRLLVVAEVALAVIMLAGAGLLIRSFGRLMRVDPGFRTEGSIAFSLSLPDAKYPERERQSAFANQLLERLDAVPGVQSTGAALGMPLSGFSWTFSMIIGGRPPAQPSEQPSAEVRVASANYFATMGIPIVKGRGFLPSDRAGTQRVLLLTEEAARQFFPGEDPIGKHVEFGWGRGDNLNLEGDIIGVVGDLKLTSLAELTRPQFWAPFEQWPVSSFTVVMHTSRDPETVLPDARRIVRELDPDLALSQVRTLDQVVTDSVAQPRFYMLLLASFAGVAILLSSIGIYGVIAYLAERRTREIGLRIALGASRGRVVRMIVGEGTLLTGLGIAVGVAGALGLSGVMRSLLFEVEPTDPATYLSVVVLLGLIALMASGLPALRAARVDPASTMRTE